MSSADISTAVVGLISLAALTGGVWLLCWRIRTNERLAQLEGAVSLLKGKFENPSFKVIVTLWPDWNAIVERGLAAAEDRESLETYISSLKKSMHGENFNFVGVFDRVSSTRQWWSRPYDFMDVPHVRGNLFEVDILHPPMSDIRIRGSELMGVYEITPAYIGQYRYQPSEGVRRFEILSTIPFNQIFNFLLDVHANVGNVVMNGIKVFPKELEEELTRNEVQYQPESMLEYLKQAGRENYDVAIDLSTHAAVRKGGAPWAQARGVEFYERKSWHHTFRTKYLVTSISMEFFEAAPGADLDPRRDVVPPPVMTMGI